MSYIAVVPDSGASHGQPFLAELGRSVRARRDALGWTRRRLAEASGLSERFLAQLELGTGNISIVRLLAVAEALGQRPSQLLEHAEARVHAGQPLVSLLGLRGAGKSTVGPILARELGVPFVELDSLVEVRAGMGLGELFGMHGERYYRDREREALGSYLAGDATGVLATGGSLVTDDESFGLLRSRSLTVWLRARPEDHFERVVAQGDHRPISASGSAMDDLRRILLAREPLYARAHLVVDTSDKTPGEVARLIAREARARRMDPTIDPVA